MGSVGFPSRRRAAAIKPQILVVSGSLEMRDVLVSAVAGLGTMQVVTNQRHDDLVLEGVRQVMIYESSSDTDIGWITTELGQHSDLRVVYISLHPWVSLDYARARCMIAPPTPRALNTRLLGRMVVELLED